VSDSSEFKERWQAAVSNHDDKALYALILRFFTQILPEITKSSANPFHLDITRFVLEQIPKILQEQYEKGLEIRHVLSQFFNEAFNQIEQEILPNYDTRYLEEESPSGPTASEDASESELGEDVFDEEESKKNPEMWKSRQENLDELLNLVDELTALSTDRANSSKEKISDFYENLPNLDPLAGSQPEIEFNTESPSKELGGVTPPIDSFDPLIPLDAQGSEYFQKKIREAFDRNLGEIFSLFAHPNIDFQETVLGALIYLIEQIPDAPGNLIQKIIKLMDRHRLPLKDLYLLLSKALDRDPTSIVFALVNYVQETMVEGQIDSDSLYNFAIIFRLFKENVEIYPDYFMGHINLFVGLLGKYTDLISGYCCAILEFFATQGDETIDALFFEIYRKIPRVSDPIKQRIVQILHNALDLSAPFILERHLEGDHLNKKLVKEITSNCSSKSAPHQEISFEIAIAMWNLNAQIQIQRGETQKKILKPIKEILTIVNKQHLYSPYLLLHALKDLDNILHELNPERSNTAFQDKFLAESLLTEEHSYFSALDYLLKQLN
jgi:hypothetical protein